MQTGFLSRLGMLQTTNKPLQNYDKEIVCTWAYVCNFNNETNDSMQADLADRPSDFHKDNTK